MFSGIIQTVVSVHTIYEGIGFRTYSVIFPKKLLSKIKIGSSVSNNGCCLTVVNIKKDLVSFNLVQETLKLTNMSLLKVGDLVNIETSIRYCDAIGGHLMTGHIDCIGKIKKIICCQKRHVIIWIQIKNKFFKKYTFLKGSIGIDGVSVTVNRVLCNYVRICLIPYTLHNTTLGTKIIGNIVNVEFDFIVKSVVQNVERILLDTSLKKQIFV